jgi:hypothetical protein
LFKEYIQYLSIIFIFTLRVIACICRQKARELTKSGKAIQQDGAVGAIKKNHRLGHKSELIEGEEHQRPSSKYMKIEGGGAMLF